MITNPILKYYGGKWRLAKWIISHFPAHEHYVEPFGGGASVLLQKEPSRIETYNDADGDVVNFFRTLRERPAELARQIELTPWSRQEFENCLTNYLAKCKDNTVARLCYPDESLENARRLYVRLWMSRHAGTLGEAGAWRRMIEKRSAVDDIKLPVLYATAQRLRIVQIENRDAIKLIGELDRPRTLFYIDPPYVTATRTDKKRYAHELDDDDHSMLAKAIRHLKGFAVLSGYACDLYKELYEDHGWQRTDTQTRANGGVARVESLWLSPRTAAALAQS